MFERINHTLDVLKNASSSLVDKKLSAWQPWVLSTETIAYSAEDGELLVVISSKFF